MALTVGRRTLGPLRCRRAFKFGEMLAGEVFMGGGAGWVEGRWAQAAVPGGHSASTELVGSVMLAICPLVKAALPRA